MGVSLFSQVTGQNETVPGWTRAGLDRMLGRIRNVVGTLAQAGQGGGGVTTPGDI